MSLPGLLVGCGSGSEPSADSASTGASSVPDRSGAPTTTMAPPSTIPTTTVTTIVSTVPRLPGRAGEPEGTSDAQRAAVVFVDGDGAVDGSGTVVAGGYVVTAAGVVGSGTSARVNRDPQSPTVSVPVVGVDPTSNLALVGPVPGVSSGIDPVSPDGHRRNDEMRTLSRQSGKEVVVESSIFLDRIDQPDFGIDLFRVAQIPGGTGGSPVIDEAGKVIGISLPARDDQTFSAIAGNSVVAAVERMRSGSGAPVDTSAAAQTSATFTVTGTAGSAVVAFAPASTERELAIKVDSKVAPTVVVEDTNGQALRADGRAFEVGQVVPGQDRPYQDWLTAGPDGRFRMTLDPDVSARLRVGTTGPGATAVSVETSIPFVVVSAPIAPVRLRSSAVQAGELGRGVLVRAYTFTARARQRLRLRLDAPVGYGQVTVVPPGASPLPVLLTRDYSAEIPGTAIDASYTATATGTFWVYVSSPVSDPLSFRLAVAG